MYSAIYSGLRSNHIQGNCNCYHYRENTQFIIKYNLLTSNVDNQITLSGYSPRQVRYQWGGYSGVDLAVDEKGLWVLWGNTASSNRLSASKIEGDVIVRTYNLATGKATGSPSSHVSFYNTIPILLIKVRFNDVWETHLKNSNLKEF